MKITETGLGKISIDLGKVQARARDLSPALKRGQLVMFDSVDKNFQQSGRPAWSPLRPATVKRKMQLGYSLKALIRTGRLKSSIAGEVTRNSLRIGTAVFYGKFHQLGTKKMAARPFLFFQRQDIADITALVMRHLQKGDL